MNIKIVIADDHQIMRDGLRALLEKEQYIRVIGEAENGRQLLKLLAELNPDILIIDIAMPELNGIETIKRIRKTDSRLKIIVLSMYSYKNYVEETLLAGANGYVLKDCTFKDLIKAIKVVYNNGTYLSNDITGVLVNAFIQQKGVTVVKNKHGLSDREREVLQLLAEGKNTKEIASTLCISIKTVETHRRQIMKKLNIYNLANLIKYAIKQGFTTI